MQQQIDQAHLDYLRAATAEAELVRQLEQARQVTATAGTVLNALKQAAEQAAKTQSEHPETGAPQ